MRKIVIIGCGNVGMSYAYAMVINGVGIDELVLIDINKEKAEGEALSGSAGAARRRPVSRSAQSAAARLCASRSRPAAECGKRADHRRARQLRQRSGSDASGVPDHGRFLHALCRRMEVLPDARSSLEPRRSAAGRERDRSGLWSHPSAAAGKAGERTFCV